MPNRNELLAQANNRRRTNRFREGYEEAIVKSLPDDLKVTRVYCGLTHTESTSSSQGQVEIDVETYAEALAIMKRPACRPSDLCRVTMERPQQGFRETVSFYPTALVKRKWYEKHEVYEIYPVLFQMMPPPGKKDAKQGIAKVYLEWFVYVRDGVYANYRVFVKHHGCRYQYWNTGPQVGGEKEGFNAVGYPAGFERTVKSLPDGPGYITIYWDRTCFNDEYTLTDLLGATEVAINV